LLNLADNGIKYTLAGEVVLAIEADRPEESGRLWTTRFSVTDTGSGVAPDQRERLFARFERGDDTAARAAPGVGLGLAIARDLVQAMGGQLTVTDAPAGPGSRFQFALTLPEFAEPKDDLRRCFTLLVVDDQLISREAAVDRLRAEGHDVIASPPEDALSVLSGRHFDGVVVDVNMPGLDGATLVRRIRELPDAAKAASAVIVLTAGADMATHQRMTRLGVVGFLEKPLRPGQIHRLLSDRLPSDRSLPADRGHPGRPHVNPH
jgi:CheY-like chemotaxis protein